MRIIEIRECLRCPYSRMNFKGQVICRKTDRIVAFTKALIEGKVHPTCPLPKKEIE